jgi:hypothetical protein
MRAGLLGNEELPVAILDIDDEEADALILSLDPLGAMAKANKEKAQKLAASVRKDLRHTFDKVPSVEEILKKNPVSKPEPRYFEKIVECPHCGEEFDSNEKFT